MNKIYTVILLFISSTVFGQINSVDKLISSDEISVPKESIINNNITDNNTTITLRNQGSGNDICTEAISLTVGTTFTCGNMATNTVAASFPNACIATSGMGVQNVKVDWYCFNSGTNNTLAIVTNNVVNNTGFNPGLAVFGPYSTCTGGCASAMSGPLCDNVLSLPVTDSIKILENISQNSFYVIALVARYDNSPTETFTYCIGVQPTNLDDCESPPTGCPSTCGNLCVFDQAGAPTVTQVTTTCTQSVFSPWMQGTGIASPADTAEICYNFRVDAGCTLNFGGVTSASGCGAGNLALSDWKIYRTSDCSIQYSGNSLPINPNVSVAGDYIFCFKFVGACDIHFGRYQYAYGTCVVQLPVELLFFSGRKINDTKNELNWATATELNNKHFEIERSNDGINFSSIGIEYSKAINGNSNYEINYQYIDNMPLQGINYYRLKQVDIDNTHKYTKIIPISNKAENDFSIIGISPSINNELPQLFFNVANDENIQLSIYNTLGQFISSNNIAVHTGSNVYEINTNILQSGIYYLMLRNNQDKQLSTKLIVK